MCCGVSGNTQMLREYLLAIYEGELLCTDCNRYCSDTETICPDCGGSLQLPIPDFLMPTQPDSDVLSNDKGE